MTTKRTPVLARKQPRKSEKPGKLRPAKAEDGRTKHGVWSLDRLLREDLDRRLKITKERDALESQLVDYAGGPEALTPTITILIKEIVHKSLIAAQAQKAALLGLFDSSNKTYLALSNSLRLDLATFENMLRQKRPRPAKTLQEIIEAESK